MGLLVDIFTETMSETYYLNDLELPFVLTSLPLPLALLQS